MPFRLAVLAALLLVVATPAWGATVSKRANVKQPFQGDPQNRDPIAYLDAMTIGEVVTTPDLLLFAPPGIDADGVREAVGSMESATWQIEDCGILSLGFLVSVEHASQLRAQAVTGAFSDTTPVEVTFQFHDYDAASGSYFPSFGSGAVRLRGYLHAVADQPVLHVSEQREADIEPSVHAVYFEMQPAAIDGSLYVATSPTDAQARPWGNACIACAPDTAIDRDFDQRTNSCDNCPDVANAGQQDGDADGLGDACDTLPTSTSIMGYVPAGGRNDQPFEASVAVSASNGLPTGTVLIGDGAAICTATLVAGSGRCTLPAPMAGTRSITATYGGDAGFDSSVGSGSYMVKATQSIVFGADPEALIFGGPARVATASASSGLAVVYSSATPQTCNVNAASGSITPLHAGNCSVRADQPGDANFVAAPGITRTWEIARAAAALSLASDVPAANVGDAVRLTARVAATALQADVGFFDGGAALAGCETIAITPAGLAICDTTALLPGTHSISARHAGDADHLPASSAAIALTVNARPALATSTTMTLLEDAANAFLLVQVSDVETPAAALSLTATPLSSSPIASVSVDDGAPRRVGIVPLTDQFGSASVRLVVTDADGASTTQDVAVTVAPVNDAPRAEFGADARHAPGAQGPQAIGGFAYNIDAGPGEAGQSVRFEVFNVDDPDDALGIVSVDANGTLRYELTGRNGVATFTVIAADDGGVADGGVDRGLSHRARVIVGSGIDLALSIERSVPADDAVLGDGAPEAAYLVRVSNAGVQRAQATRLRVTPRAGLRGVAWACVPAAACMPGDGLGAADVRFDLATDASVTLQVSGEVVLEADYVVIDAMVSHENVPPRADHQRGVVEPIGPHNVFGTGFE